MNEGRLSTGLYVNILIFLDEEGKLQRSELPAIFSLMFGTYRNTIVQACLVILKIMSNNFSFPYLQFTDNVATSKTDG